MRTFVAAPKAEGQYPGISKLELEGKLDGAGTADLVEGVEATIGAAGAQAAGQRLRRLAEEGAGQVVVGIAEIWMVEDVEELGSKTKPHLFGKVKLPLLACLP